MQVNRIMLQQALEAVKPGLANKEIIEQSSSFAFINNQVVTYNDEISISHPIPGLHLTGAIQADKLYSLLSKLKKEEVEITPNENEVVIECGKAKASFAFQSEIKIPIQDISKITDWKPLPEPFIKFMSFSMASCGKDMSRPKLTAVHVNQDGYIEASDGYRITRCQLDKKFPVGTFLIPASSVTNVVKLKPTFIAESELGWVHFKTDKGTVLSCRILEKDVYEDTSTHIQVEGIEFTFPQLIGEVIDRASIFAKREYIMDETLRITLANKRLKVQAESNDGKFEEEINIRYEDTPTTFSIKPYLLKGILSETLTCILCDTKLKFQGDNWVYVTALEETV